MSVESIHETRDAIESKRRVMKTYKQLCDEANRRDGEPLWDQGVVEADRREDHDRWVRAGRPWR